MAEDKKPETARAAGEEAAAKAAESPWFSMLRDVAKQVLGALLTGAGLLAFVAFAGAVIVWTRFEAIEVPPDQAVKAVPRDELVASGASLLLIFGFFGVLAVLATYLVDRGGRATPGVSRVLLGLVALEGITGMVLAGELSMLSVGIGLGFLFFIGLVLIATLHDSIAVYKDELAPREGETEVPLRGPNSIFDTEGLLRLSMGVMVGILVLCTAAGVLLGVQMLVEPEDMVVVALVRFGIGICGLGIFVLLRRASREIKESQAGDTRTIAEAECKAEMKARSRRQVEEQKLKGRIEWRVRDLRRAWEWLGGLAPTPAATERDRAGIGKPVGKRRPHRLELTQRGVSMFLVLAGFAIVVPAGLLHHWWLAVSFGAAFVLAAGVWRVAILPKSNFFWYGLVVFVSVPLFGTLMLMARNVEDPQVQPVAMIRSTDGPGESIQGIYVTEASNRVYFANVATEGCEDEVVENSGRLLWVPKKEVVAMSVGPLQDVKDAGLSALEMAYALTPEVETPTGARVSLAIEEGEGAPEDVGDSAASSDVPAGDSNDSDGDTPSDGSDGGSEDESGDAGEGASSEATGEEAGEKQEEEEEDPTDAHRLESAGPAVRPNFGAGLKLVPPAAEPGDVVELRMSDPNEDVGGFGKRPGGYTLRLNGVRLEIQRVSTRDPLRAEYVETADGKVLPLKRTPETTKLEQIVRLKEEAGVKVEGGGYALTLDGNKLAVYGDEPQRVTLPNGEPEELKPELLRRAWNPTRIKFWVPEGAETGGITVECGQLAGQPVLTVVEPPKAQVVVRMQPGSGRVIFDSSHSGPKGADAAEGGEAPKLTRRWTIAGRRAGDAAVVSALLPERLGPYEVSLTVSDSSGLSDTVELQILRLPASRFPLGETEPVSEQDLKQVGRALRDAMDEGGPEAIELEGHADAVGDERFNAALSLERVERLRELLFSLDADASGEQADASAVELPLPNDEEKIPIIMRAFGESCPIVAGPGPQELNRRVEVFLLGPGAVVKPAEGCRAARVKRVNW